MHAELTWTTAQTFTATSGSSSMVVDGTGESAPSPMQAVAIGLAGCMGVDVVMILQRGRHALSALRVALEADRQPDPPRKFVRIRLVFCVAGDVPTHAIERAIALSREKYCSVWHSLNPAIELSTSFEQTP